VSTKRLAPILVALVAAGLVLAAVLLGGRLVSGGSSLLRDVAVTYDRITPNADGDRDITPISYVISRNATVSIYLEDAGGQRYYFRREKPRGAGEYEVLFSGVVDGFRLPGETIEGEILSRLLPDGEYTWTIEATDDAGVTERQQGRLTVAEGDPVLPELRNFTLDKSRFTPNRDGIDDRVLAQFFLPKDVASTRVFLQLPDGRELPISEQERDVPANTAGRHT
jgi:hypothetical protein